jgi:serine protease AprX
MKRFLTLAALALFAAGCQDGPVTSGPVAPESGASFTLTADPALNDALAGATETDTLQVIAVFDDSVTTADAVTQAVQGTGAGVIRFQHLPMVAALATPGQIEAIQSITGVTGVYLNAQLDYHNAQGVESINADDVHALGITGKGIGVAILDSGIDGLHPDLLYPSKTVANVKYIADLKQKFAFAGTEVSVASRLFVDNVVNSETTIGHGTHVAGTAAGTGEASGGKYKGVAPGASLIGIGAGDILFIFWTLAGFDYVLENQARHNIKVVNNSWGSAGGKYDPNAPINVATKKVTDAGVTVVFSAGNSGPGQNTMNRWSIAPWVISVAAGCKLTDDANAATWRSRCQDPNGRDPVLANFSSRGIPGDPIYHPDITAPGVYIVSTRASTGTVINALSSVNDAIRCAINLEHEPYYTCASGTSMSAPHISGVVALMQEAADGKLKPAKVIEILTKTARPLDGFAEWEVGAGYADALEAVKISRR